MSSLRRDKKVVRNVHCEPLGLRTVKLMLKGYENLSVTAGTPLCVDETSPFESWNTFCNRNVRR